MILLNQLDLSNPNLVYLFMGIYGLVQIFQIIVIIYIYFKIKGENSQTEIITEPSFGKPSQKITQCEYDLQELKSMATKSIFPTFISLFLWYKYDVVRHFPIQSIMNPMTLWSEKLFKIFIIGEEPKGDLKRPFKAEVNWLQKWVEDKAEGQEKETEESDGKKKKKEKKKDQ